MKDSSVVQGCSCNDHIYVGNACKEVIMNHEAVEMSPNHSVHGLISLINSKPKHSDSNIVAPVYH